MKVLYDYQILVLQRYGGISRYFFEIISKSTTINSNYKYKLPIVFTQNYYFEKLIDKKTVKFKNKVFNWLARFINEIYTIFILIRLKLRGENIDIVHPTFYSPYYYRFLKLMFKDAKQVVTVHDMIKEKYQDGALNRNKKVKQKKNMIFEADAIISISNYTKKDLLECYPELNPQKVYVIHHGQDSIDTKNELTIVSDLPEKYILFVGNRGGYKNFNLLIEAMGMVHKIYSDIHIVCVGGGKLSDVECKLVKKIGMEGLIYQGDMTDSELYYTYNNAICFVFPSLYEGFGIPILEAFECSCPVILSASSCFPEIGGDAVEYLYNNDSQELQNKILNIINNKSLRNDMIEKGKQRVNQFRWNKTAEETLRVYDSIVKSV